MPQSSSLEIFDVGGRVGGDLQRVEWERTPLGDPVGWPDALKSVIRLLLGSRFSMWMAWGPELTFFCNDAYRRDTLGKKYPWALGRPAREVWKEIWPEIGPRIEGVLGSGEATWDESLLLFLERSGYVEETYHTFSYSPLYDEAGAVSGMLCVVTEDTERVIAERRMATLRDLGTVPVAGEDERGFLRAAAAQLARNPRSLPFTLLYVFDEEGHAHLAAASGTRAGEEVAPERIESGDPRQPWPADRLAHEGEILVELRGRFQELPSGDEWDEPPAHALVLPIPSVEGTPYGFFVAATNPYRAVDEDYRAFLALIAQRLGAGLASARSYEAERRRAAALAELDQAKSDFFANVSHELRTPLTLIAGPSEEALADEREPTAARARWELVRRNAGRLRRLVDDMLDFARIEAGRLEPELVPCDVAELTRGLAASFAPALERAGLCLQTEIPDSLTAQLDTEMWEKIVLNLLSNALKYTQRGSVRVHLRAAEERLELIVEDTGVGIPASELPRLFERFHRVRGTQGRSHEGAGIGLALVQELVRLHGGAVEVASEQGRGSTFTVSLPHVLAPRAPEPRAIPDGPLTTYLEEALQWSQDDAPPLAAAQTQAGRATVLVVDDNPDLRAFAGSLLSREWNVLQAADGVEALELIGERAPDLLLTDVMMPRMDGIELLRKLRGDPATATIPAILLSARAGEEAAIEGLAAGADDYLPKPFSAQDLLARVRSNLELAAMRGREGEYRSALLNALGTGVAVARSDGTIVDINDAFEQLVGYGREGLPYPYPQPWIVDLAEDPQGRSSADAAHEAFLERGAGEFLVPARHRGGARMWLAVSIAPMELAGRENGAGEMLAVCSIRDVTSLQATARQEAAVTRLLEALADAPDTESGLQGALAVLREELGAEQAAVIVESDAQAEWRLKIDPEPQPHGPGLDARARRCLARAAPLRPPELVLARSETDPTRVEGLAAALDEGSALWLSFAAATPLSDGSRSLLALLVSHIGTALARARQEAQAHDVAITLQHAILGPTSLPRGFAARYEPAVRPLQVGGDWYDVVALGEGRYGVMVGDCVGRGLSAAAVMGQLRSAAEALMLSAPGPCEVLDQLEMFARRLPGAFCATALCAYIDTDAGTLTYSTAGHVPAMLLNADGSSQLLEEARTVPLAVPVSAERREAQIALTEGATLLLYTDGLIERRGQALDEGFARLADWLSRSLDLTLDELAGELMRSHAPPDGYEDDVAVLLYRHLPKRLELEFPADPEVLVEVRERVRRWLRAADLHDDARDAVVLAVGEAASNVVVHSGSRERGTPMTVSLSLSDQGVEATVADRGRWKEPDLQPVRGGRGLKIIAAIVDRFEITQGREGTEIRILKRPDR